MVSNVNPLIEKALKDSSRPGDGAWLLKAIEGKEAEDSHFFQHLRRVEIWPPGCREPSPRIMSHILDALSFNQKCCITELWVSFASVSLENTDQLAEILQNNRSIKHLTLHGPSNQKLYRFLFSAAAKKNLCLDSWCVLGQRWNDMLGHALENLLSKPTTRIKRFVVNARSPAVRAVLSERVYHPIESLELRGFVNSSQLDSLCLSHLSELSLGLRQSTGYLFDSLGSNMVSLHLTISQDFVSSNRLLLHDIPRLPHLESLSLNTASHIHLYTLACAVMHLGSAFRSLSLACHETSTDDWRILGPCLERLERLDVRFRREDNDEQEDLDHRERAVAMTASLHGLPKLTHLALDTTLFGHAEHQALVDVLPSLENLRSLCLVHDNNHAADLGLAKAVEAHPMLTHLNVPCCDSWNRMCYAAQFRRIQGQMLLERGARLSLWPHILHKLIRDGWYNIVFCLLQEKHEAFFGFSQNKII